MRPVWNPVRGTVGSDEIGGGGRGVLRGGNGVLRERGNEALRGGNGVLRGGNEALRGGNGVLRGGNGVLRGGNGALRASGCGLLRGGSRTGLSLIDRLPMLVCRCGDGGSEGKENSPSGGRGVNGGNL